MNLKSVFLMALVLAAGCNEQKVKEKIVPHTEKQEQEEAPKKFDRNLGLPQVEIPKNNPMSKEKVALGKKLFEDTRFSSTGEVSCSTCHDEAKGFTDQLVVSEGINGLKGTRNAPTVLNAAFNATQFWDGRSPTLEDQSRHPFVNSVEMGLKNHEPILEVVRTDPEYVKAFKTVFNKSVKEIKIEHVTMAIGAFERTVIAGNSRFDQWYYKGEKSLSDSELRGFQTFIGNGRCVSCHAIEQSSGLFTDHRFHNIGVGINRVPKEDVDRLVTEFLKANFNREEVDEKVLNDLKTSELGRFAVTQNQNDIGAFKTSTLRNIDLTAPYMHDGSLKTLEDVVEHYNRGGASSDKEVITPFLSGGIRPLNLTDQEKKDLVAFMKSLTSTDLEKK
ncbi:cytochrome-c peroxidase [Peredibacter sp. HCB2-198]|uniref:cytochrome-c peroxidase n=1 Tax=Peredibacter sp. HCB2-198 TaxID=3383025 RepID=UPI0038B4FF40